MIRMNRAFPFLRLFFSERDAPLNKNFFNFPDLFFEFDQ